MVTASSIAASASSLRPRSASQADWLFSDAARSGRNAGVAGGFDQCASQKSWTERVGASQVEDRGLAAEPMASPTSKVEV
jgi:hypothetical protein